MRGIGCIKSFKSLLPQSWEEGRQRPDARAQAHSDSSEMLLGVDMLQEKKIHILWLTGN